MFKQIQLALAAAQALGIAAQVPKDRRNLNSSRNGGDRGGHSVAAERRAARARRNVRARSSKGGRPAHIERRREQQRLRLIAACKRSSDGTASRRDLELITSYGIPKMFQNAAISAAFKGSVFEPKAAA